MVRHFCLCVCLLLSIASPLASACDTQLKVIISPSFGRAFLNGFLSQELEALSSATGCQPRVITTNTFADMLRHIKDNVYDVLIVPSMFHPYLSRLNYDWVVSGFPLLGLIVARSNSSIYILSDVKGYKVLMNDPLSQAVANWKLLEEKNGVAGENTILYAGKTEQLLYQILDDQADVTFTVSILMDRLSPKFRKKLRIIYREKNEDPAVIMVNKKLDASVKLKIQNNLAKEDIRWKKREPSIYFIPPEMESDVQKKLGLGPL